MPNDLLIQFNSALYSRFPKEFISPYFEFLVKTFKKDFEKNFTTTITNEIELFFFIHLSHALQKLKNCEGFSDHINEFKNDKNSAYFVTVLADYLMPLSSNISLEPTSAGLLKKADILVCINNQDIYFECKDPKHDIFPIIEQEHEEMYAALHKFISKPCDISVTYSETLTKDQLTELGNFLKSKLLLITGEGEILNYKGVKVEVTNVREQFSDIGDIRITRLWCKSSA